MSKPTDEDLRDRFLNTLNLGIEGRKNHAWISEATHALAIDIRNRCPDGHDLAMAIRALEEVRMKVKMAIGFDS